jgi:hypothetical protein
MRWALLIIGVLLILMGAIWILQGAGILLGSPMTGDTFWTWAGLLVVIVGGVLCYSGLRRQPSPPKP